MKKQAKPKINKRFFGYSGKELACLIVLGSVAGLVNGFLGTGGGIILIFGAMLFLPSQRERKKEVFAETAAVTLVFSAVSAVIYLIKGQFSFGSSLKFCLPALLGGGLGALLLDKLPTNAVGKIFSVIVIIAGGIMLFR
ncbi:MAG: sulfite exporter TauE/SafE family protein [Clostridia bacterium]|nr:sulfite exporter TauE/SafE family protein [Clostridia bacterium]